MILTAFILHPLHLDEHGLIAVKARSTKEHTKLTWFSLSHLFIGLRSLVMPLALFGTSESCSSLL